MGMEQDGNLGPLAADARPSTPPPGVCAHTGPESGLSDGEDSLEVTRSPGLSGSPSPFPAHSPALEDPQLQGPEERYITCGPHGTVGPLMPLTSPSGNLLVILGFCPHLWDGDELGEL